MTMLIKTLAACAASTALATSAFAQTAKEIRGASPYIAIENEPAPKLIAAWEYPELFAAELRAAFKSLRSAAPARKG